MKSLTHFVVIKIQSRKIKILKRPKIFDIMIFRCNIFRVKILPGGQRIQFWNKVLILNFQRDGKRLFYDEFFGYGQIYCWGYIYSGCIWIFFLVFAISSFCFSRQFEVHCCNQLSFYYRLWKDIMITTQMKTWITFFA